METSQKVIKQVCMVWDITPELLLGQSRRAHHAEPRMVAAYVMMKLGMNATEAGRALGGRHPSTITHAHDVVSGRMPSNRRLADKVNLIVEACEVQARVYIPLNGYANPSDTYQLLRQHLEIIDTLRAQTLHAMSLLPEPPQRDIAGEGLKPTGWINIGAEYITPEQVDAVGEALLNPADKQGVGV